MDCLDNRRAPLTGSFLFLYDSKTRLAELNAYKVVSLPERIFFSAGILW